MRSRTDDAALVRRTQAGDEGAFEAIFKRHHVPLLSYCRHTLGNQDEAEDALQQAFIKAHKALLGGTAPRELRPWLYAIARNCCLSAIAARRGRAGIESLTEDHTPALVGLSDEVRQREDLRELLAGIGRLPEDQRSALLLAELDDLDHRAIATIVGCQVSKVKALIYQARSSLIADRDAGNTPCQEIREQLSVAHGGELRRGPLRRHLKLCVGCRDFQLAVSAQRQSLGVLLPVAPSAGLAAAILGHGAAHAVGAASVGGASAGAGGSGIAASGTAATTTAVGAGTSAGAGAAGGTGVGALVGGGLVTKLAVGGAVVVLASAGAVTVHNREASASSHRSAHVPADLRPAAAAADRAAGNGERTEIADSGLPGSGSPASLALDSPTGPGGPTSSASPAEPSGLGGVNPLLAPAVTPAPDTPAPSGVAPGSPGQPLTVTPGQRKNSAEGDPTARAEHRAELARHRALLRHQALLRRKAALLRRRASARRRALLRHEALLRREAFLRQQLAERRRARRQALERKQPPVKLAPLPIAAPAPARTPHRKGDPAPSSGGAVQPGTSTKNSEVKEALETREAREAKAKKAREAKEAREKKEATEAKEAEEAKEAKEARETEESGAKAAAGKTSAGKG